MKRGYPLWQMLCHCSVVVERYLRVETCSHSEAAQTPVNRCRSSLSRGNALSGVTLFDAAFPRTSTTPEIVVSMMAVYTRLNNFKIHWPAVTSPWVGLRDSREQLRLFRSMYYLWSLLLLPLQTPPRSDLAVNIHSLKK